ncbi:MAG: PaREP1 family protein [Candidatus Njordarchaeales archaeon]
MEIIIDSVISLIDPDKRVEIYIRLHEKYLEEANSFAKKGDLVQACEKYWEAVTALLNAIGEIKKLPHYSHRDYSEIIERIAEEVNDPSLSSLFASAERIHANFYHNFLKKATFEELRRNVLELVKKLKNYVSSLIRN